MVEFGSANAVEREGGGALDEKQDGPAMTKASAQFQPHRTIAARYMWRALESVPYDDSMN